MIIHCYSFLTGIKISCLQYMFLNKQQTVINGAQQLYCIICLFVLMISLKEKFSIGTILNHQQTKSLAGIAVTMKVMIAQHVNSIKSSQYLNGLPFQHETLLLRLKKSLPPHIENFTHNEMKLVLHIDEVNFSLRIKRLHRIK